MHSNTDYTLTALLHEGAYAALYRGVNKGGVPVVVKLLKREYPTPEELARLEHEYRIVRDLDNAGVVKAYSLEKLGNGLALIFEDFGGVGLDDLLAQRRLEGKEVLEIFIAVADALSAIHARHIIHKDVKPSNILVNPETRQTKLIDFGISTRLFQEASRTRRQDGFSGTFAYMSPEQTGRTNRATDSRTDLYSLGVTLYEALTGSLPFPTSDVMDLVHSHIARLPQAPRERAPEIPETLSNLVMKLLAKDPEDRYQTAEGLKADLQRCLSAWEETGTIDPFPLGQRDFARSLRIPQRLYGREKEITTLLAAFERAVQGSAELLLVSGYSGVGKSSLVKEIYRAIAGHTGYLGTGKFDQLGRDVPYSGIAAALGEFVQQLLMEQDESVARWKRLISAAVRSNAKVLTDIVPGLSLILEEPPDVPELPPALAENRFTVVFQDFLGVFATAKRPLVLFLEDLQWADVASLKLLELLMTGPERGYLLVVGTYRSNEIDAAHPLHRTLRTIAGAAAINAIELGPLGPEDVRRFVADALGDDPERTAPLADVVYEKTQGNPFFVMQFLSALQRDELLVRAADACVFSWDLAQIRTRMATDNVVAFIVGRLRRLPLRAQRTLSLAACIGHEFDLHTLAIIREDAPATVASELWGALEEGILIPLDQAYRFYDSPEHAPATDFSVSYRFVHDRVQQAAYSLIDEGERAAVHLRIGRLLRANPAGTSREALFEIASHLNLSAALITDPKERRELAQLNLDAGRKARGAAAYGVAAGYLARGAAVLDEASWEDAYPLAFALHLEWALCEAQTGAHAVVESLQDILLKHAKTDLDRAQVLERRLNLYSAQGRHRDAIAAGLAALRILGIPIWDTEEEWKAALEAEMAAVTTNLADRALADLADAPLMTDMRPRAAMTILMSMASPALGFSQPLHHWIAAKAVNLSLVYGSTDASPRAYALYGVVLSVFMVRPDEGYAFGKLGLALHEKIGSLRGAAMFSTLFVSSGFYSAHYRSLIPYLERGTLAGLESGEFLFLSYCRSHIAIFIISLGEPLPALKEELARSLALVRRTKVGSTEAILTIARQMVANLEGQTENRWTLSDEAFDEDRFVAHVERSGFTVAHCWYWTIKGELLFLYEEHEAAVAALTRAKAGVSLGFEPDMCYYLALSILARLPTCPEEEKRKLGPLLERCAEDMALYARSCADSFLHKLLLLQAEQARVAGDALRAMELYDQAIAAARSNEWTRDIALANELAAKFYRSLGRIRIARMYMREAHHFYLRWGASAKASQLLELHPDIVPRAPIPVDAPDMTRTTVTASATTGAVTTTTATTTGDGVQFDVAALIRAAEAIAGEIVFDRLLSRLMRVVVENAGAERGALLLKQDGSGELVIAATVSPAAEAVILSPPVPIDRHALDAPVCPAIVHYVARTHKGVVLHDAAREGGFVHDPHIQAHRSKSVLCMPVLQQGTLRGVLYLENDLTTGAFTEERAELLRVLCGQMAISIENATLYANLEQKVKERTRELKEAQARLVKLEREVTEVQMAGGFAHEMRNALTGAKLSIGAAYREETESLCFENARMLTEIAQELVRAPPEQALSEVVPRLKQIRRNEERLDKVLMTVDKAVDRALRVTKMILEYSQIGKEQPGDRELPVRPVVEGVLEQLSTALADRRIEARVDIRLERTIVARKEHLATIVRNLVQNACDAIASRTDSGPRELRIEEAEEPERWLLRIADTGVGVDAEHRSQIFAPFFSTNPAAGVGLGLGIAAKLVSLYRGSITFESEVGVGTTFTVAFPSPERVSVTEA